MRLSLKRATVCVLHTRKQLTYVGFEHRQLTGQSTRRTSFDQGMRSVYL
jgi:hypothetical protein